MNRLFLILDCNYLCHRAKHTMKDLSFDGDATGVVYGFLKDTIAFKEKFNTKYIIFCWDYGKGVREKACKTYKANRKEKEYTEEEIEFDIAMRKQMTMLRTKYLRKIGYRNIFYQAGYEGDDIMASVCHNLPKGDEAVLVTADHDMYQLLSGNVGIYNLHKRILYTTQKFKQEYDITPDRWATVKAISGCSSDNVIGVSGVGEKKAIQYLNDAMNKKTETFKKIKEFCWSKKLRPKFLLNLSLTLLPYAGTNIFKLKKDKVSKEGWQSVCDELGMKSIRDTTIKNKKRKRMF